MSQTPTLADARRAAILVVHFGRRDVDGVNEIVRQVADEDDPAAATARLLFGVLEMYAAIVPMLHTPRGLGLLNQMVVDLASADPDDRP
jgi:hypothetical protein